VLSDFKIDYKGPVSDTKWFLRGGLDYNFTIPRTTPPGEYLVRIDVFWPRAQDQSQFYVNCAQINVIGSGGGECAFSYLNWAEECFVEYELTW